MIRIALVICAGLLVAGCASFGNIFDALNPKPPAQPKGLLFCDAMNQQGGPFRWSPKDTRPTKERADQINAVGVDACGWK